MVNTPDSNVRLMHSTIYIYLQSDLNAFVVLFSIENRNGVMRDTVQQSQQLISSFVCSCVAVFLGDTDYVMFYTNNGEIT